MSANKHSHDCQEIALSHYGETIYMTFTEQRNILRNKLHKISVVVKTFLKNSRPKTKTSGPWSRDQDKDLRTKQHYKISLQV